MSGFKGLKKAINIVLVLALIVFVWWFNTYTLKTETVEISDSRIRNEITIVQISDLHGYEFGRDNQSLIDGIKEQKPDLIFATGDMFSNGSEDGQEIALKLLSALTDVAPVYYVNGEHDNLDEFDLSLEKAGVNVLDYEDEVVNIGETRLHLYGINNVYYTDSFDLANEYTLDESEYNILLAHIPNFSKFASFGMDLSLCGDTHGGQVRLPFVGAVYSSKGWFPEKNGEYMDGLYELDGKKLFISSGLGSNPIPLRFWNRPEISVIKLVPEQNNV